MRTDLKAGPEQESRSSWGLFHYLGPKTKDLVFMKGLRKLRVSDDERVVRKECIQSEVDRTEKSH